MIEEKETGQAIPEGEAEETIEDHKTSETEAGEEISQVSAQEVEALRSELQECQAKSEEYLDGWQRARAEFSNYKKRVEREKAQVYTNAAGSVVKRFLEIVDDLDLALKNRPTDGDGAAWTDGIELVYRKLSAAIEADGVTIMEVEGKFFDPNYHEAITSEENDEFESGQIIEVVKQGYMLADRVLRPALVRVAK